MPLTKYGDISPRTAGFAAAKLLDVAQPLLTTERFGQFDPQGKNKTKTRKWRRYESFPPAIAPLSEGITPEAQVPTYTDVTATLEQYGATVQLTDVIKDTHEDDVLKEMMTRCGEQAAETIETIRIAVLKAGTNVFYANGVASRTIVNSPATVADFQKVKRSLKRNKAREISQIVKASAGIGTQAVAPAYFAMGHTDLEPDLKNLKGFIHAKDYANSAQALPGEVGSVDGIRIILTTMFTPWLAAGVAGTTYLSGGTAPASSLAADVYPIIVVARDAYAIVPLQGQNAVTPVVLNPGMPNGADPLGQRGYVSWKTMQTAAILNHNYIARLEVACTANPT